MPKGSLFSSSSFLTILAIKFIIASSSWKSTLGIKGRARAEQKKNAQIYINTIYGIKATQDECDAICIGTHYTKLPSDEGFNWAD